MQFFIFRKAENAYNHMRMVTNNINQGAALLEGAERVAACEQLCAGLLPGEEGPRGLPPALLDLLRNHAMGHWGEDLPDPVSSRLREGGLPPLDIFLANPSAVAGKLLSLQVGRSYAWTYD